MSSINPYFTIQYQQPDEYRFSHDSVFLARRVFEILRDESVKFSHILDLCAGCGVVALDFLFHWQAAQLNLPGKTDFLEVQSIYQKYFAHNVAQIPKMNSFEFLNLNYDQVFNQPKLKKQYDLILCNPPYFKVEAGLLSPSDFKNRCRFFIDSNFIELVRAIQYLLSPSGRAYVLIKDFNPDELDLPDLAVKFTWLEKIRATDLYLIQST